MFTLLPETMIPVVAILAAVFAGRDPETAGEIGIGAILGAPFMLATLAMFVVGASALTFRNRRAQGSEIRCREVAADEFPWCKAPGKAVPTAASTLPTAPWPRVRRPPRISIALVKSEAATTIVPSAIAYSRNTGKATSSLAENPPSIIMAAGAATPCGPATSPGPVRAGMAAAGARIP
jgi:hypothetical protein